MNTPVSFELAKLLKEKGFDEPCLFFYSAMEGQEGLLLPVADSLDSIVDFIKNKKTFFDKPSINLRINKTLCNSYAEKTLTAPTIADAVMWIYEKHGIWIQPKRISKNEFECFYIGSNLCEIQIKGIFNSPTEAYEAAIEYCLNNLINQ